ncbi:MAG: hypothetical protein DMF61_24285 [Blastocatellia bacterium AA13]|nr:MAG: hypothetical protein DMF61_24285 [Blastocatellia bacterium AA13]
MKTWLVVFLVVLSDSAGNVFVTKGMKEVGEVTSYRPMALLRVARQALTNVMMAMGVLCMAVAFFSFIALLSWADLSFVLPATALGYVVSVVGAHYVLKENISAARWIGTIIICLGVALISLNSGD